MTDRQREVYKQMNNLVHTRSNEKELNKKLSKIFGKEIAVEDCTDNLEDWTGDWYFSFNVWDAGEIGGFFDIYFLKMRDNSDGLDFYITEVTCDFCEI